LVLIDRIGALFGRADHHEVEIWRDHLFSAAARFRFRPYQLRDGVFYGKAVDEGYQGFIVSDVPKAVTNVERFRRLI
jgi:hypothetical protein